MSNNVLPLQVGNSFWYKKLTSGIITLPARGPPSNWFWVCISASQQKKIIPLQPQNKPRRHFFNLHWSPALAPVANLVIFKFLCAPLPERWTKPLFAQLRIIPHRFLERMVITPSCTTSPGHHTRRPSTSIPPVGGARESQATKTCYRRPAPLLLMNCPQVPLKSQRPGKGLGVGFGHESIFFPSGWHHE